jgi:hypothetical protein
VDRYAREIVPAFNAYLYFRTGYWIVPLGINYDRVLEDRTLLSSLEGKKTGRLRAVLGTLRFVLHNLSLIAKSEWHRLGRRWRGSGAISWTRWAASCPWR